jgi:hypothetical protein
VAFQELPTPGKPKPFGQLLVESVRLYRSAFLPMVAVAALGILLSIGLETMWTASSLTAALAWSLVTQIPIFIAEASLIVLAGQVRQQQLPSIPIALAVSFGLAPKYVTGSLLINLAGTGSLVLTSLPPAVFVGIAVGLFLTARWALFGPLVVVEHLRVTDALRASWNLVKGRTFRTLGMVLVLQVAILSGTLLALGVAGANSPLGLQVLLRTAGQAIATPLAVIFVLLLYEDYRRLERERDRERTGDAPELPLAPQ